MSPKILVLAIVALLVVGVSGCGTSKEADQADTMQKPADPGPGVPPGHCRVVADVVSLEECTSTPCNGVIRIVEVKGYGSAFNAPLSKGSELQVTFVKSVEALKVGASFQADLAHAAMSISGSDDKKPAFTISDFEIR